MRCLFWKSGWLGADCARLSAADPLGIPSAPLGAPDPARGRSCPSSPKPGSPVIVDPRTAGGAPSPPRCSESAPRRFHAAAASPAMQSTARVLKLPTTRSRLARGALRASPTRLRSSSVPGRSGKQLIALSQERSRMLNYGSAGSGRRSISPASVHEDAGRNLWHVRTRAEARSDRPHSGHPGQFGSTRRPRAYAFGMLSHGFTTPKRGTSAQPTFSKRDCPLRGGAWYAVFCARPTPRTMSRISTESCAAMKLPGRARAIGPQNDRAGRRAALRRSAFFHARSQVERSFWLCAKAYLDRSQERNTDRFA